MVRIRGGLLASTGATALIARGGWSRARAPEGDGDGGGGGGGAADLLEDDAAAAAAAAAASGGGDDAAAAAAAAAAAGGDDLDFSWATGVKAEPDEGQDASNMDWLKGTKVKDLNSLVKIARDNQKAARESGRVKIPGADAKPEEVKAFREAIGVPEEPKGYEVKLPETADGKFELDTAFLDPLRAVAHANNVPAAAFQALADTFMQGQLESNVADAHAANAERDAKIKEWGAAADSRKEEFKRGAQVLGLGKADLQQIQAGYGVGRTMDLFAKIGTMAGEDFYASGNASERFGVSDLASAQKALDAMINDPDTAKKLRDKSDPALVSKYKRLVEAAGHYREIESKK